MEAKFKICLSTIQWWNHFIEKGFKLTAELGYEAVEFAANRPFCRAEECTKEDIERIKKALKENGLKCVAITTNNGTYDWCLSSPYETVHKSTITHIKKSIELAHALGAEIVESESGPGRIVEDDPLEEWKRTRDAYIELVDYAANYNIIIAQEASRNPLVRQSHCVETIQDSIQMVKEVNSKYLQVCLDTVHTAQDPIMGLPEAVELAAPWLVHVHAADSPLTHHEHLPIGEGKIDWEVFVNALKKIGYDRYVNVELGFVSDPTAAAYRALQTLKKYM